MTGKTLVKQYYLKKEDFHSHLNVEDLTDADYVHVRRVCKDSQIKNLGEFHDLYVCFYHITYMFQSESTLYIC